MGSLRIILDKVFFRDDQGSLHELKHSENLGLSLVYTQSTSELEPNKYYNFGDVTVDLKITRLLSRNPSILESYRGEFSILEGGKVTFPKNIRWEKEPKFIPGYTYQYRIENGIGTYIKVKNER